LSIHIKQLYANTIAATFKHGKILYVLNVYSNNYTMIKGRQQPVATTPHQLLLRRKRPNEASGGINQSRGRIFSPITGLAILANQNRRDCI
jgi:hypothetical protein